jgi:hypothetical protein
VSLASPRKREAVTGGRAKQSRLVRNRWLYCGNLLGLYWFCIPLSNLLYLLAKPLYRSRVFVERVAPRLGFGHHVQAIAQFLPGRVWAEVACAFLYQGAVLDPGPRVERLALRALALLHALVGKGYPHLMAAPRPAPQGLHDADARNDRQSR